MEGINKSSVSLFTTVLYYSLFRRKFARKFIEFASSRQGDMELAALLADAVGPCHGSPHHARAMGQYL